MARQELILQAIESAKCRIYKLNFDLEGKLSALHQRKAENQKELMEITVEALEKLLEEVTDTNVGNKWIPCSERLPDINFKIHCFVTIKHKDSDYSFVQRLEWVDDHWVHETSFRKLSDMWEVLAWQPIKYPRPYKEAAR